MPTVASTSLPLRLLVWLGCAACIGDPAASPERPSAKRYGVAEGLSHNAVHAIVQDRHGFLWFGTQDGLDRFDGADVVHYRAGVDDGLASGFVTALAESGDGTLWVGTRRGLHRIEPERRTLTRFALPDPLPAPPVHRLAAVGQDLWVGSDAGLFRIDTAPGPASLAVHAALPGRRVQTLAVGTDRVWVLVHGEPCLLYAFDADGEATLAARPAPCVQALLAGDDGRLWLDLEQAWDPTNEPAPPAPDLGPWQLMRHRGQLLASAERGVRRRPWSGGNGSGSGAEAWLWRGLRRDGQQTLSSETLAMAGDRDGGLWLGTYDGVFHFDPHAPRFAHLGAGGDQQDVLSTASVSSIWAAPDSPYLWIGTFGAGLLQWHRDRGHLRVLRHKPGEASSLCSDYMFSLVGDADDSVLVDARCRVHVDGRVEPLPAPPAGVVRAATRDAAGTVWLTAGDGLYRLTPEGSERVLEGEFESVHAGDDAFLWLTSRGSDALHIDDRIFRFEPRSGAVTSYNLGVGESLWDVLPTRAWIWVATGGGLVRLDPASGETRRFVPTDEDAGRVFYSLSEDRRGRLWLGSNRGLLRFDPDAQAGHDFRAYDPGDGTGNWEFNRRARFLDGDGKLYLGGMTGVTVFEPEAVHADPSSPRAMLDRMRILGAGGERGGSLLGVERLRLDPGDLALELSFTAPLFTRGDRARFRYRLLGFDPDWRSAGEERSARYTNLPPGDYRFEVMAANADNVWSTTPATLALRVVPPFHATAWFRGLALLALLVVLWLAYRLRVRHLLALERMRLDIAADLHDELGSELAAIGVGAAMVARGRGLEEGERRRLEGVRSSAETVMQSLRDIVWYVNPDKDRLEALIERMRRHAGSVLGALSWQLDAKGTTRDLPMDMRVRRQVYLIFREALSNLVRHAGARSVSIAIGVDGTRFDMTIGDDGCGFDPARPGGDGSGLANMRRRAAAIGADFAIDSAAGCGTRIRLGLDMTHSRRVRRPRRGAG